MRHVSPMFKALVLAGALASTLTNAQADQCFSRAQTTAYPILEGAPPPTLPDSNYQYYPVNIAATAQLDSLTKPRPATIQGAYWQWGNHGPRDRDDGAKGNITPGSYGVQIRFSSIEAANDCTIAQTQVLVGAPRKVASKLTFDTAGQTHDTTDVCVLPTHKLNNATAVLLDYEVADGRTAAQTLVFLSTWADLVRSAGYSPILYCNPWNAPTQRLTNLNNTNGAQVTAKFDLVSIMIWSGMVIRDVQKSFNAQKQIASLVPKKTMVVFELNGTTIDDAKAVHNLLQSRQASVLAFWRNGAVVGGTCGSIINMKIACAAYGRCG